MEALFGCSTVCKAPDRYSIIKLETDQKAPPYDTFNCDQYIFKTATKGNNAKASIMEIYF